MVALAGRNDDAIAEALRMSAGSIGQIPQANAGNRNGDDDEYRALGKFQRNNPPVFEYKHEPDKAQAWLKEIEKIFRVMNYCRRKKEVEFLELKQGNGTIVVYAAKFQELIKYCPHYNTANAERPKCFKFVNGLRHDVKKAIGYQQITRFTELVNKSRIYDEDSRESHHAVDCPKEVVTCFKCGKIGHKANKCGIGAGVTCYNCGEQGHISTKCTKPKKEQVKGEVFALSGVETTTDERLIQDLMVKVDRLYCVDKHEVNIVV
ncbi:uncharacterized protein LOC131618796 [Vicia villosa]|uniref:uncharacterized protein LOC131618796 n=1 Tax=Vicia villosa TaxID=3911 RepID=UPI00273B4319|nr:uncharacterized protein LOC131618796 [Vicia villosa]